MNPVKDYHLVIKKQDNTTPGAEAEQNRKHKERLSGV